MQNMNRRDYSESNNGLAEGLDLNLPAVDAGGSSNPAPIETNPHPVRERNFMFSGGTSATVNANSQQPLAPYGPYPLRIAAFNHYLESYDSDGLQTRRNFSTASMAVADALAQFRLSSRSDGIRVNLHNIAPNAVEHLRSTTTTRRSRGPDAMMAEVERAYQGLSEEEIVMNVQRPIHCRACFESEHAGEMCCICQEDYDYGENIGKLRCNHMYHFGCIREWLMQKNFCPICKALAINREGAVVR